MDKHSDAPSPTLVIPGGRHLRRVANPRRQASYDDEVRQLIRATQVVMLDKGRTEQPKVIDIVREAGMTNQAFYRHFRSRDDVIIATYEQGLLTVHEYLEHQVLKYPDLDYRLRAWIDGVLRQIDDPRLAELSAVIFWNVNQVPREKSEIEPVGRTRILQLLVTIMGDAGVDTPGRAALFVQTLVMGMTSRYLEVGERPSEDERECLVQFCMRGIGRL